MGSSRIYGFAGRASAACRKYKLPGMKLEQFAMERMQSTYENLVEFNLSESGVRPLTARELIAGPGRARGPAGPAARLLAVERHHRAAPGDRRDVSGRRHRSHRGHQRRVRSQLHHHLQPDRAGRRSRDAGAELHADVGLVARVRRHDSRVAPGRGSRGRALAHRPRRARAAWCRRAPR